MKDKYSTISLFLLSILHVIGEITALLATTATKYEK